MHCLNCGKEVAPGHWYKASGKPRCWDRFWTRDKDFRLMTLWEKGYSDAEIAERMGTTKDAVHIHRKRIRLVRGVERQAVMTAREVQRVLGIGCAKTVVRWVERGWLKGRRGKGFGLSRAMLITEDDLRRFLADERYWCNWKPERITDPPLQKWAIELRAGDAFLTLGEAAERFGVNAGTIGSWIDKGWLPNIRPGLRGNHVVRLSDVERLAPTYVYGDGLDRSNAA